MGKLITQEEIGRRIGNLINGVSADFGRQARLTIEAVFSQRKPMDGMLADAQKVLEGFESRVPVEREKLAAERRRQQEEDRRAVLELERERAFALAFERPRSTREIVELCDRAGTVLEVLANNQIGISGTPLSLFLRLLLEMNHDRVVDFLISRKKVHTVI